MRYAICDPSPKPTNHLICDMRQICDMGRWRLGLLGFQETQLMHLVTYLFLGRLNIVSAVVRFFVGFFVFECSRAICWLAEAFIYSAA